MHRWNLCFNLDQCPSPQADGHYMLTDIVIPCFSGAHRYYHSVLSLCPQPSAWTQIKKWNTDCTEIHGLVFHGSIFWFNLANDTWIPLWIYWDLRVLTHSLFWRYQCYYSAYCHQPPPNLKPICSAYCHQPPPSLPRRGGTDTIGYMIFVSSRLIINGLSAAIVTVPPLRGRLGGGWSSGAE